MYRSLELSSTKYVSLRCEPTSDTLATSGFRFLISGFISDFGFDF